jgi:hypothetical protein
MMVEVVNMYQGRCHPPWGQPGDVLIDRRSVFGNPFPIGRCLVNGKPEEFSRESCIQRYRQYFNNGEVVKITDRNGTRVWDANIARQHFPELLKANRLGCWCKPQACHGDLLKAAIDQSLGVPPPSNYTPPVEKKKLSLKDFGISSQTTLKSGSYINEKGDLVKTYKRKKKAIKPKPKRKCRCK